MDQFGGGGGQRSAITSAVAMAEAGITVVLLAARSGTYEGDIPEGIPRCVLAPSWPRPVSIAALVMGLRRSIRTFDIDALVVSGFSVGRLTLLVRALGLLGDTRVVVVERNTLSLDLRDRFRRPLARGLVRRTSAWLYRQADALAAVSDGVARDLETTLALPRHSVTTIVNPVDRSRIAAALDEAPPERWLADFLQLERPIIITSGRLVAQKAHGDLIDAFAALPPSDRGSLVILGEGPGRHRLREQAEQAGIAPRVWMPGFVENPWWFIARSDVFALTSRWEGNPRALLEALACGTPVVSTDCPSGPRDILKNVARSRLVAVGDRPAITAAISELLKLEPCAPDERELDRYALSEVASQYVQLLMAEIGSKGRRGEHPTFAVIIPTRDMGDVLHQALRTVLDQSLHPDEVIVVDDGSRDDSTTKVRLEFPGVRVISTPRHGVAHARNIGIDAASSDYIAFKDADDFWAPDHLAALASAIREFPDAGLVATGAGSHRLPLEHLVRGGRAIGRGGPALRWFAPARNARKVDIFRESASRPMAFTSSSIAVKRSIVVESGLRFPEIEQNEDQVFRHELSFITDVVATRRRTVYISGHARSATTGLRRRSYEALELDCTAYLERPAVKHLLSRRVALAVHLQRSIDLYLDALVTRSWRSMIYLDLQDCGRAASATLNYPSQPRALLFRLVANTPRPIFRVSSRLLRAVRPLGPDNLPISPFVRWGSGDWQRNRWSHRKLSDGRPAGGRALPPGAD